MSDFIKINEKIVGATENDAALADLHRTLDQVVSDEAVWNQLVLLGVNREIALKNIIQVLDFQASYHSYLKCHEAGHCLSPDEHLLTKLRKENDILVRIYEPCPYAEEHKARQENLWYNDFPSELIDLRLSDTKRISITRNNMLVVKSLLKALEGDKKWIYLAGQPKVGKSFLVTAFINEALSKKLGSVAFINTTKRIREINDLNFTNKAEFDRRLAELQMVDILVLDGFGDEYINDFIRDTIILPLLNARDDHNLLTIFTSGNTLNQIGVLYSGKTKAGEIRAQQLTRLIKGKINQEFYLTGLPL